MEARLPIIERYALGPVLGQGGMGVTYDAHDTTSQQPVAVKFLRGELAADPAEVERFLINAGALTGLDSEHLIRVLDSGHSLGGVPFLVM